MILMKDILKEGNKKLYKENEYVSIPLNKNIIEKIKAMREFIINSNDPELSKKYNLRAAVGLAAPQIGINKKFFVLHLEDFDNIQYDLAIINPIITSHSQTLVYLPDGEGCLSVTKPTTGLTPRYEWIVVEGYLFDYNLETCIPFEMKLDGFIGICFQHEYDHLDGVLFTSKEFNKLPNAKNVFSLDKYSHLFKEETKKDEVYGEKLKNK